jgi:hypothetical protein
MDAVVKSKIPCSCQESNPGRPDRSLVTILTELSRLMTYMVHGATCVLRRLYATL